MGGGCFYARTFVLCTHHTYWGTQFVPSKPYPQPPPPLLDIHKSINISWWNHRRMASPMQSLLSSRLLDRRRSATPNPPGLSGSASPIPTPRSASRDSERARPKSRMATSQATQADLSPQLQRSVLSAVKNRAGSVLARGFILKTDHYPSGASQNVFA